MEDLRPITYQLPGVPVSELVTYCQNKANMTGRREYLQLTTGDIITIEPHPARHHTYRG